MNPIPLRHQRRVYAYACGRCHQVYDGGSIRSAILDADSERLYRDRQAGHSKHEAERCCTCRGCGVELPGRRTGYCDPCHARHTEKMVAALSESAARNAARDARNNAAVVDAGGDVDCADQLFRFMEETIGSCWYGGWPIGSEGILWALAQDAGVDHEWGQGTVTADDTARLRRLSDAARGWWRWDDDAGGPVFVPLDAWKASREATR